MVKGVELFGPVIRVSNLTEAIGFFEKIGFKADALWGDPPQYAVMVLADNEAHSLHLAQKDGVSPDGVGLFFISEDVDEIYARAKESGLTILHSIGDRAYGMRDFAVVGPDDIQVSIGKELG